MERGFICCTTQRETIKIPVSAARTNIAVYTSDVNNFDGSKLNLVEVPFAIVHNTRTDKDEIHIARPIGSIFWCIIDFVNEEVPELYAVQPDKFYYTYDIRTGLIHFISDTNEEPRNLGYNICFEQAEKNDFKDPLYFGIKDNDFMSITDALVGTFFKKADTTSKLGVITSWNTPCGIAEYSRQLLDLCEFPYIILAPYANDLIREDEDYVLRCFARNNIVLLKETIQKLNIDNLWINFSYSFFDDDLAVEFIKWLEEESIRYTLFSHSKIKDIHEDIFHNVYSGSQLSSCCVPIAPPKFDEKVKVKPNTLGTFGFAHKHKNFEAPYQFIKQNNAVHYHIWTSLGQGPGAKEASIDYVNYLHSKAEEMGISSNIHIHLGFIPEDELLRNLASCAVLILPYRDMPSESQSAAIRTLVATGRPIVTSAIPQLLGLGELSFTDEDNASEVLFNAFASIGAYEHSALLNKQLYTKEDELYKHFEQIKPYGNVKLLWRGDFGGIKSFSLVNRKYIKILQGWGAEIALRPDNIDFVLEQKGDYLEEAFRHPQSKDMISTGLHFPPLVGYATMPIGAWEIDKCPEFWAGAKGPEFRKLIVISNWVKEACIRGGFKEDELVVVPLGTDNFDYSYTKNNIYSVSNQMELDRPFTFLNVSVPEPRKGTDILVAAYLREFSKSDNVLLVLKCSSRDQWVHDLVDRFSTNNSAPILLLEKKVSSLNDLYKSADVFVHPLRGEGFGLPVLEAAGFGIPSIIPRYAGPVDFTNNDTSWYIDYKIRKSEYHHEVEGARWANPNERHLRHLMRYCYNHPDEVMEKGLNSFVHSLKFSWNHSAHKLIKVFEDF